MKMATKRKIETEKVTIQKVFKDFWFRIPEYQRSYVWQSDNITELLEDIFFAAENNPDSEYFLGSLVLQKRSVTDSVHGAEIVYNEYDLLDGQQRMTTILLILAVIRDLAEKDGLKKSCCNFIYQQEDEFEQIPERLRMVYKIRDKVETFIQKHIKQTGGTQLTSELQIEAEIKNLSISNMASGVLAIHEYFSDKAQADIEKFAKHLFNNVIVIYVASEELEDAFRLFTILNSRGVPLTNADILKSLNLGEVSEIDSIKMAERWEELESSMGNEDFNRLLSFIRTIYVKEKARENIVKEFEEKIYKAKPALLKKGKETFEAIFSYADIYKKVIFLEDLPPAVPNAFQNLIIIMWYGLPSNDWIPPLLAYYKKFQHVQLLDFTIRLNNKFSADWICQLGPSSRINNMANVLKAIEKAKTPNDLINDSIVFDYSVEDIKRNIGDKIYRKRFGKYILLLLEHLMHDHNTVFPEFTKLSVEHILPQNPSTKSEWVKLFTADDMEQNIHKLGNLLLISRSKNSALGRKDFLEKKKAYFSDSVSVFPNSLRVMQFNEWTLPLLEQRHKELINKVIKHYI
ncbi:DUF262 domain-containing protein [Pedobacter sp.]|uniref:DUF262 domain-containing protein n=1 Tax=Pedobacter sp. TaxID=1411316 RepID=UPI003D7F2112